MIPGSTTLGHARLIALVVGVTAASGLAQVKAGFPGPRRAGSPTPLQRSMPSNSAPPAIPQAPAGGVVGGVGGLHRSGATITGSGLTVNGSFSNDNLNVDFHLGAQPAVQGTRVWFPSGTCWYYPYSCYRGWGWYNRYYNGYYDNSNQRYAVIDGALIQQTSAAVPTAGVSTTPAAPPTDAQVAASLLKSGDADSAVDKYRLLLRDDPDNAEAMRALAVALLVKGEPELAVAMMSMAYRTDPLLADQSLPGGDLFKSDADLRRSLQKAVTFANKIKSASAWLTVAVLMQAEGRSDHAGRMIDRAAEAGLDAALVKRFKAALGV